MTLVRTFVLSLLALVTMPALALADVAPGKCSAAYVGTTAGSAGLLVAILGIALLARGRRRE